MQQRDYRATVEYLYERLPMFSRVGARALKPGLDNTIRLCAAAGNPQDLFKSIHIAGTNGKGSTSHMMAAIFQKCGYKTGLYTSPHLVDFRERIRINGIEVSEEFVVGFVDQYQDAIDEIKPSFFEITVAMAFSAFAAERVDIAVIETGLGGRLDSTNIIRPELSIITNISLDHTDLLGDTRPKIAVEKAGIIKKGITVVIGEKDPETELVFRDVAYANEADILFAEDAFEVIPQARKGATQLFNVREFPDGEPHKIELDLKGAYQAQNLRTVLTAHKELHKGGWLLPLGKVQEALREVTALTGLHGRYEVIGTRPLIIADVAHNAAGLKAVLEQWAKEPKIQKHIVLGFVRDKDVAAALKLFPKDNIYYCTAANIPRALPVEELCEMALGEGLKAMRCEGVEDAMDTALRGTNGDDAILITGSFFIVGEALEYLRRRPV